MILDKTDAAFLLGVLHQYLEDWGPDLADDELEELERVAARLYVEASR